MSKRQVVHVTSEEALRQTTIIHKLAERQAGKHLKYCISTFGCQMNSRDSEKIEGMLEQIGYTKTEIEKEADFILYNTCCVRENAELKIYGRLGALKGIKRKNPNLIIALCGCMMQQDIVLDTLKKKYNFVDIIFGTYNIYKLPELLQTRLETNKSVIDIWDSYQDIVEDLPNARKYDHKACVNIMYGCNNFCTYCIVPYVRGRERSREMSDILHEIQGLVADGVKEVMLLGQNVNSYGKNLETPVSFAELLKAIGDIEGLKRIRFMTSHPKDLSDELIEVMASCEKVCKSIHLPVQAGSSRLLAKMNRHYTKESYLEVVRKLRQAMPDIEITTDLIVGFPGETEEDFLDTLDLVEKVGYASAFTFIYSKRTGTPAATMEEQVPEEVTKERFNRLLKVTNQTGLKVMERQVGKTLEVFFEEVSKQDETVLSGRTESGLLVNTKASKTLLGEFAQVKIIGTKTHYLIGELV
ncbi:tRNA (N6-isopentenyl adenosine(37)-C2)-methylthiotransferase MiaB [Sporanaerobium hydrogeniformans]|uniref:tRNA (N6-isopentenyl adenosine(37)-C2)-methylthiotransferase MiaB n=1 Tax=Sporanaerobium hydrogeniformans TaxID=3072179 RepID=A0AC61DBT3_9FIRM|nr:tRNA (N6-isopentenyl adenosine(37)-C2)-methylthiotransferase MiaB [Sporanaerobium hydrogeniformans]PHV70734.1 tRNA (N6-isopentenyl adenosine(37)-C2)-methylthiotransferase MiaB [Sporanaerobium hydrogeniformans]